ncbi:MAG: ATP synthase F0, A subunit, partial [Candidatus Roizmanbacteria bacterium GW2011_GWA2_34_18]
FFNFSDPISFFVGILDILSEFSKVLSFAFRLFGNIFAGEVLLTIVAFLVPVLASFPFIALEIFVGFVQALVFSMLTAVFLSNAVVEHH